MKNSKYKNIYFTYLFSKGSSKGAIILLDGIPSNPSSKESLMEDLSEKGYDVFFPRYEGTLESKGTFLERSPSEPIGEFIDSLKNGDIFEEEYKPSKIFLLGSSFGGMVSLNLADKTSIDKICVVSPVVSFKEVNGIETLGDYLAKERSKEYRFNSSDWEKLISDSIINLKELKSSSDILIIGGKNDGQINEETLAEFSKDKEILFKSLDLGHISLSKIPSDTLSEILDFFS